MKKIIFIFYSFIKNHLLKALLSFFFINGIVFLVDNKLAITELANSATLRNIQNASHSDTYKFDNNSKSIVILISNKMFEKEFNSKTPLNKEKLLTLIKTINNQKAKAIILDFDISPDYNFGTKTDNLEALIYKYLMDISNDNKIILPFSFFANTNENKNLKNRWIKQMCKNGIDFAYPYINSEIGVVLNYYNYNNHISIYSNNLLNENIKNKAPCEKIKEIDFDELQKQSTIKLFNSSTFPINYSQINKQTFVINNINDLNKIDISDKVVFLGGGYGFTDKYQTAYGEKFGVEILNAIYYTQNHKIDIASVNFTTILDILLGLFFGIFLSLILKKRISLNSENQKVIINLLLITYLIGFITFSTFISTYIFHNLYIWLNPIPIIIGMFIDMILGIDNKKLKEDLKSSWLRLLIRYIFVFIGLFTFF